MKRKKPFRAAKILYPAAILGAFVYLWLAGAFVTAIVASAIGTMGYAYGLANE
jgi:hypothetical protein